MTVFLTVKCSHEIIFCLQFLLNRVLHYLCFLYLGYSPYLETSQFIHLSHILFSKLKSMETLLKNSFFSEAFPDPTPTSCQLEFIILLLSFLLCIKKLYRIYVTLTYLVYVFSFHYCVSALFRAGIVS